MGRRSRRGKAFNFKFSPLANELLDDPTYWALSPGANKLYQYFLLTWNGYNNGKLIAPFPLVSSRRIVGSEQTLANALQELRAKGFIRLVAVGSKRLKLANRYAIIRPDLGIDWNPKDTPENGYFIPP